MDELEAVSPIDGRYYQKLENLSKYFSEFALIKKRVYVEIEYLKALGKGDFTDLFTDFDLDEAKKIKEIEIKTNHDVKAVEYYIKEKLPAKSREFVHYGLTSEDINNLSYNLLIKEFLTEIYIKNLKALQNKLLNLSKELKAVPMLSRTHGQPASPTTAGKEFYVFFTRLQKQLAKLNEIELTGKLNGATGNYNALFFADPTTDWIQFSKDFIQTLGLSPSLITTQIESNDTMIELFQCVKRINNIILDLDRDVWLYISFEYFHLKKKETEVGSSTMPHKINPIEFENSEGNFKIANSLFTAFEELQVSRLQRDLSNSTMFRNIGVAFAHSYLAIDSTLRGLTKLDPAIDKIDSDLNSHPEVLTQAVQTILRKHNIENAYEKLKLLSRGEKLTLDDIRLFISRLEIEEKYKEKLLKLNVKDYIGLARELVDYRL